MEAVRANSTQKGSVPGSEMSSVPLMGTRSPVPPAPLLCRHRSPLSLSASSAETTDPHAATMSTPQPR